ncbi:Sensory box histidine kinase/response regulator [hydrothermal vent metagenome]|uniref:Sensory box histidine kinase/response regulator n=1 Tax=hydrothermal vent metagenome TaxID=652676 RepID=A0A1W1CK02_9ZZZZ
MEKVLKYSGHLRLLYMTTKKPLSQATYKALAPFFAQVTVSKGLESYTVDNQNPHAYPDIVIVDVEDNWDNGLDIIHKILSLNKTQMIVVLNPSYSSEQLSILMYLHILYSLKKPLEFKALYRVAFDASKELYDKRLAISKYNALHQRVSELDDSIKSTQYARETKDEFFASISHEIRTPINAVIGLSHILSEANLEDKYKDYVDKIQTSGNIILNIVNDILDFSKIEAGKLQIENIEFNINTVLENASTMVAFKAYEKKLDLTFEIDASVPALLQGDPLRLSQVLINLLTNAIKFTSEGEIILSAKLLPQNKGEDLLEFCVSDTGIGLSPAQIANLFQSFTQASTDTARNYGGTGLGLTISKQLVELMGGTIHVNSIVNEGSQFIFTFATKALSNDLYTLSSPTIRDKKVIIVDKHNKSKASLERILEYFSYSIIETPFFQDFHLLVDKEDLDIIFMDKETISECNLDLFPKDCTAKIILMHTHQELKEDTLSQGIVIDAHLDKPFNPQKIVSTLLKVFGEESEDLKDKKLHKNSLQPLIGSKILLVDDNKINQSVVEALLEDTGIEVITADNGQKAIELAQDTKDLDLIFMDIEMPILNGYETTLAIRRLKRLDNIPIVAFSGNIRQEDKKKSLEVGMVAHLAKPINVNDFYTALLEFISMKRDFNERLEDAINEFQALIGVGNFQEALTLSRLLITEAESEEAIAVIEVLQSIEKNILRYEKVFLVLINNYNKAFKTFMGVSQKLKNKESLTDKEENMINMQEGLRIYKNEASYSKLLNTFCHTFRDSVGVLEKRIQTFKFEEAIQLIFQIRKDSLALNLTFITNSIAPIVGIEKTQKRQLEESLESFIESVKSRESA